MKRTIVLLALVLAGYSSPTLAKPTHYSPHDDRAVELNSIPQLVLRKGAMTTGRRTAPVPQLKCVEGSACGTSSEPNVVHCTNIGVDYSTGDPSWKCTAELENGLRLGTTDVICEGFRNRDDPWVLRGSCGLEYTIHGNPVNAGRSYDSYGQPYKAYSGYRSYSSSSGRSWLNWILGSIFLYFVFRWFSGPSGDAATRGATFGTGGGGGGGAWPGGFGRFFGGGGGGGRGAPFYGGGGLGPGYTPNDCNNNANNGPGFWPGFLGGAGLGYLFGRNNNNNNYQRDYYQRQAGWWNTFGGFAAPRPHYGGGYDGGYAAPAAPAAPTGPATQTSTGYGGTRRRG